MVRYKARSAIEYLTTNTWMLITIFIVCRVVFTTVQSVSELNRGVMHVENFRVGEQGLKPNVKAATSDPVEISNVFLSDSETGETFFNSESLVVAVGEIDSVNITSVESSETRNTVDATVYYDVGEIDDLNFERYIAGSFDLNSSLSCNAVPEPMTSSSLEVVQQ